MNKISEKNNIEYISKSKTDDLNDEESKLIKIDNKKFKYFSEIYSIKFYQQFENKNYNLHKDKHNEIFELENDYNLLENSFFF